jgi:hypothetical protein
MQGNDKSGRTLRRSSYQGTAVLLTTRKPRTGGGTRAQGWSSQPTHLRAANGTGCPSQSAADVRRMLAETMADVKAGRMDPKVANTLAYIGTALLRAYEADMASSTNTQPGHTCR